MKKYTAHLNMAGAQPGETLKPKQRGKVLGHYQTLDAAKRRATQEVSTWNKIHGYIPMVYDNHADTVITTLRGM